MFSIPIILQAILPTGCGLFSLFTVLVSTFMNLKLSFDFVDLAAARGGKGFFFRLQEDPWEGCEC